MNCRILLSVFLLALFALLLANCSAFSAPSLGKECQVTRSPDRPFVPPAPYSSDAGSNEFLYGSPALWTFVYPDWHVHSGGKLPFFRQGYDWRKEGRPNLTVVARRLDRQEPLVWNGPAGSGYTDDRPAGMFMVTGIDIPSSGCWEITARYIDTPGNTGTLTYTVWAAP
jgi:hypothetical protein